MAAPQLRQPPLMLGLAGLMPQIACVLIALGDDEVRHAAIVAGGLYAAMILSFLGGMWWMQALSRSDARWWPYALAVVPSLVGWASLTPWLTGLAAPRPALVVLGVALLASPAGDRAIGSFGCDVPPWRRLRQLLSGGLGSLTIILSALPGAA